METDGMNGFRTALIVCGVLIMAFVMLWSTYQQRHQQRRSAMGRFGGTDADLEPAGDGVTGADMAGDSVPDDNTVSAMDADAAPSSGSGSRRFSVSEPGAADPVSLGRADGTRVARESPSTSAPGASRSARPSFRSRLGQSRLGGISSRSFGRFSAEKGSDDRTAKANGSGSTSASVTSVGPLGPVTPAAGATDAASNATATRPSRLQRGLNTGRRFMPSRPRRAARPSDPRRRSDIETPRLTMPSFDQSPDASIETGAGDASHVDPAGSLQPALSQQTVSAVPGDSPDAAPGLSVSTAGGVETRESAPSKEPTASRSTSDRNPWWRVSLPRFGRANTPTGAAEVAAESGRQHPSEVFGKKEANREEREMFKRSSEQNDQRTSENRTKKANSARSGATSPLRARQTSPASLWGEGGNASADNRSDNGRRNPRNASGAERRATKDTVGSPPARADRKSQRSPFGSRYSRARRRSQNKTQAVRDSSRQDSGVFAGLLDRLSSAVGKSDSRPPRPSRRHQFEKNDAVEPREPMLTVSGFDQMSEEKMILPGDHLDSPPASHAVSERDNAGNIDRLRVGSARGGSSSQLSREDRELSRRELERELVNAEHVAHEPLKPQFDLAAIDTSRQIDQIAQIADLSRPVSRDEVLSIYRSNDYRISKPVRIIGLSAIDSSWVDLEQEPETGEYSEIVLTVQLYDASGPVDESDLHRFSDVVLQTADRIGGRPRFAMSFEDALDHAGSLELFCKDYDRLAILSIVVGESSPIAGEPLREFADSRGLLLNSVNIYHWPNTDPEGSPWRFGIANLFEPGTFDDDPHSGFETRGLRLFMSIPTVREPEKVFDDMVTVAQDLCVRFSATIVDQNKKPLSEQGIADIRRQMVAVSEEMRDHGFAPGDENTVRIFPEFGQD